MDGFYSLLNSVAVISESFKATRAVKESCLWMKRFPPSTEIYMLSGPLAKQVSSGIYVGMILSKKPTLWDQILLGQVIDGWMIIVILHPFQQYFSHIRTM